MTSVLLTVGGLDAWREYFRKLHSIYLSHSPIMWRDITTACSNCGRTILAITFTLWRWVKASAAQLWRSVPMLRDPRSLTLAAPRRFSLRPSLYRSIPWTNYLKPGL